MRRLNWTFLKVGLLSPYICHYLPAKLPGSKYSCINAFISLAPKTPRHSSDQGKKGENDNQLQLLQEGSKRKVES
jgi:hypothetical protein